MENAKCLRITIAIFLIASWTTPEYGRYLFESDSHIDKFTVILFVAGLFLEWKYIEDFILGFYLVSIVFVITAGMLSNPYEIHEKPGFIIHSLTFILVIVPTIYLIRLKRSKVGKQISKGK